MVYSDMSRILKTSRAAALFLLCAATLVPAFLIGSLPLIGKDSELKMRARCMMLFAKLSCFFLGIRVIAAGRKPGKEPLFIVGNHCSYLDIIVIGSLTPAIFVSKDDVRAWPLLGLLAQKAGTVFVNRNSKAASIAGMEEIRGKLSSGVNVVLFPEGTTNNGSTILDFKSTFFDVPAKSGHLVLPVSIRYSHINGIPVTEETKNSVAWYGDMELLPHLRNLLGLRSITALVGFAATVQAADRKILSMRAYECVKNGYETLRSETLPGA